MKAYIKDLQGGSVREYGTNQHDSLVISEDGRTLSYYNLQCGDDSRYGDFRFCDENGLVPEENEVLARYGVDEYFNVGGWRAPEWIPVKEGLPEKEGNYLVSFDDGFVCSTSFEDGDWELWADAGEVLAWMPQPEAYKEEL